MRNFVMVVVTVIDMAVVNGIVMVVGIAQELELVKEFVHEADSSLSPWFSSLFHEPCCSP